MLNHQLLNSKKLELLRFRQSLIAWGKDHMRSFPWRDTNDPYQILMAEVMLHRTQAVQVVPVFEKFVALYPNIVALSKASIKDLYSILNSLGLHWRTELILKMVRQIMEKFGGNIPKGKEDLLSLPGVSNYIASAVRCFSWNIPEPILDTNTVRVIGRVLGLEVRDSSRRSKPFKDLMAQLVDTKKPRSFNYALLDLADQICTIKKPPICEKCPIRLWCQYAFHNRPELFKGNDL